MEVRLAVWLFKLWCGYLSPEVLNKLGKTFPFTNSRNRQPLLTILFVPLESFPSISKLRDALGIYLCACFS